MISTVECQHKQLLSYSTVPEQAVVVVVILLSELSVQTLVFAFEAVVYYFRLPLKKRILFWALQNVSTTSSTLAKTEVGHHTMQSHHCSHRLLFLRQVVPHQITIATNVDVCSLQFIP